jgi:hypothetical protein
MAKLKSGTRIYGTATIDTSVVVGSAITLSSSGIQVVGVVTATTFVGALTGTASSTTNIPNLTGAITSVGTATTLGSFTSAQLATALTDETGSGANVFATSPTLVTPALGAATATSIVVGSGVTITANGINVVGVVTATDFNSASDLTLKTNIQSISNPIDKILQINGVTFNWRESNKPSVGIIAQEIEKVFPELVQGENPKTVNYNGLIGLLIEAIKEQQIEINNLKDKLK